MVRSEDYYQILEIELNATNLDIRRAYRRLALKWHPDKNLHNIHESTRKFKQISEAYQILGDLIRRRDYDYDLVKNHHRPSPPPPPPPPSAQPKTPKEDFDEFKDYNKRRGSATSSESSSSRSTSFDEMGSGPGSSDAKSSSEESESEPTTTTRKPPPEYTFRNPYDVFDEFFGSHLFSRDKSQNSDHGVGGNGNDIRNDPQKWPTPVIHYKDKELQARRSIVKKMTMVGEGGSRTTIKIKTVTMRENGRERATVSESFENGILRSTSIKDESGQMTTFH